jgi:hypothetical protein
VAALIGVLDQPRHLRQLGVRTHACRAYDQPATRVDGGSDHLVTGRDFYRDGLAGEHARVDGGGPVDDLSVGPHLLPWPDDEEVADGQLVDRYADLPAVAQHRGVPRAQLKQRPHRLAGAPLRAGLEVAPGQQEHGHRGRDLEVDLVRARAAGRQQIKAHPHPGLTGAAEEQRVQRPAERGQHPEADQRVHGRGGVPQVDPGRTVERPRTPHHHRRSQRERQPLPVVELQR